MRSLAFFAAIVVVSIGPGATGFYTLLFGAWALIEARQYLARRRRRTPVVVGDLPRSSRFSAG